MRELHKVFEKMAIKVSKVVGSPYWFVFSVMLVVIWFPSGFFIGFNEIWHLLINSTTTILTFLMMSLLHASQSKWERRMEQLELKQQRFIELLEVQTQEIVRDIKPNSTK